MEEAGSDAEDGDEAGSDAEEADSGDDDEDAGDAASGTNYSWYFIRGLYSAQVPQQQKCLNF